MNILTDLYCGCSKAASATIIDDFKNNERSITSAPDWPLLHEYTYSRSQSTFPSLNSERRTLIFEWSEGFMPYFSHEIQIKSLEPHLNSTYRSKVIHRGVPYYDNILILSRLFLHTPTAYFYWFGCDYGIITQYGEKWSDTILLSAYMLIRYCSIPIVYKWISCQAGVCHLDGE